MRMVIHIWEEKQKGAGLGMWPPVCRFLSILCFQDYMFPFSCSSCVLSPESLLFNLSREGPSRRQLGREGEWKSRLLTVSSKQFSCFSNTCTLTLRDHSWLQFLSLKELCNTNQFTSWHDLYDLYLLSCFKNFAVLIHSPILYFSSGVMSFIPLLQENFRRGWRWICF